MKIQYCSDLHLEFPRNKVYLEENPIPIVGDILLLAGDIVPFSQIENHSAFFDRLSDQFEQVYWVPGNHEYYHGDLLARTGSFQEAIRANIQLLNNKVIELPGYKLIFSTLWSKISVKNQLSISYGMSDFKVIRKLGLPFTPEDFNQLFFENFAFLQSVVNKKEDEKLVVISHHIPTFKNYPLEYKDSILNEAFAVELEDFIESSNIDYWIYGHHHRNVDGFTIGNTQLLTNQLGYLARGENEGFDNGRLI